MIEFNYIVYSLSIAGQCYSIIKIYKLIKKGKQEKNKTLKATALALFYEPFLIYDTVKHFRKSKEVIIN